MKTAEKEKEKMTDNVLQLQVALSALLAAKTPQEYSAASERVDDAEDRVLEEQRAKHPYSRLVRGRN